MTSLQRLAIDAPPIFLRLLLAVTFIWAGLTKIVPTEMPVTPDNADALAEIGAIGPEDVPDADEEPSLTVRNVNGVALGIYHAANPGEFPEDHERAGESRPIVWPDALGSGHWPVTLAWTVALTEVLAGIALFLGLLTRLAALSMAGVMLGAAWLTQFGPAIQEGATRLGFLPDHSLMTVQPWQTLLWQFALFMSAMALVFAGSGVASLDRVLFCRKDKKQGDAPKKPQENNG